MPMCAACGADNREGARFCDVCGALLAAVEAAQRKTVTVVFCDVVGSTALGESTDPEALRELLARYFERMRAIVEHHGGSVEKFVGDAVMAVFGVPVVHEDDAVRALRAAAEMRAVLPELGVEARFGVDSGEVVAGTEERLATGDAVNVAARLQQAAAPGEILLGAQTLALARDAVTVEGLAPLELKGKARPVEAYRLVAVHQPAERRHEARFVGRGDDLAFLRNAWERALEHGRCELVTVVGEPGVGKSRLVAEFLADLDARVVRGRCLSYGEGISYRPVVEVLRQLDALPAEPGAATVLRALLGQGDAPSSPEEIAWAFRKLLEQSAPLVVVFDDIHWGEEVFLDLVEHVALLSAGAPVLLVCMARPELRERRPQWPLALELDPLAPGDVDELLPATVPAELRERIAHAAGGNPLFLTEMLAVAADTTGDVVVPPTLKALLAMRLDQLESGERGVLERGAVEGEIFHRGAVQALAPTETQVTPRLAALVRRHLIRPDRPQLPGEDGFRFCHLLIRDAAYDALPKATRAELHERFADWLDDAGADLVERDELVGYHLEQAHRYHAELGHPDPSLGERAAAHLTTAGRRAADRGDFPAAANLTTRALALGVTDQRERVRLQLELAALLGGLLQTTQARAVLDEATQTATRLEQRDLVAAARLRGLSASFAARYGSEEWRRSLEDAIGTLTEFGDDVGLSEACFLLAQDHRRNGRVAAACADLERALMHAEASGNLRLRPVSDFTYALCAGPMPVDDAIRRCEELRRASAGQPVAEAIIDRALSLLCATAAREGDAREYDRRSSEVLDQLGTRHSAVLTRLRAAADAQLLLGDAAAAERHLLASAPIYAAQNTGMGRHVFALVTSKLAMLYCDQGRWDEAERLLSPEAAPAIPYAELMLRPAALARLRAHRGELDAALTLARSTVEVAKQSDFVDLGARVWLALAEVLRAAVQPSEADAAVETAIGLYERKGNVAAAAAVRACVPGAT